MTHSGLTSVALDAAFFRFAITSLQKIVVRELRGLLGTSQALPIGQTPPCSKWDAALRDFMAARFYQAASRAHRQKYLMDSVGQGMILW